MPSIIEQSSFTVPDHLRKLPDPILGISRLYEQDPRSGKIDAGIGVFKGEDGATFVPSAVKQAIAELGAVPTDYLSPTGEEEYLGERAFLQETARIVFGSAAKKLLDERKLAAIGSPGGTGAVAIVLKTFKELSPDLPVVIGVPTWPNHIQIAAKVNIQTIQYPHVENNQYNIDGHVSAIQSAPKDALVLFHTGKTHNPTGMNPTTPGDWRTLARAMNGRLALFDTPYAGFGDDLTRDTEAIRIFMDEGIQVAVAMSYSKNGGIYNKRTGGLLIPMASQADTLELQRLLNSQARTAYSSPPADGEYIMAKVLSSPSLRAQWEKDLAQAAGDLKDRRQLFANELPDYGFVATRQTGLFSMLPLNPGQVTRLQTEHGVYMSSSGRVNFGGIPQDKIPAFATAIKKVL